MAFMTCPVCGLPAVPPVQMVRSVRFPADVDSIADLCLGRFNTQRHLCGEAISFVGAVAIARPATKEMVLTGEPPADAHRAADEKGWSVWVVEDYNGLARRIIDWIQEETMTFWPALTDGSFWQLDLRAAVDQLSPIQLLAMKLARDRILTPVVTRVNDPSAPPQPPPEELLTTINDLGVSLTILQLKRVLQIAILDGHGGELEAAIRARVPVDCLDDAVLGALAEEAKSAFSSKPHPDLLSLHRMLVTCAAAHLLAGQMNPAANQLAALLAGLYNLQQRDDVVLDERVWLTPAQLRRLVDDDTARQAVASIAQGDPQGLLGVRSAEFLQRLGWSDLYREITSDMVIKTAARHRQLLDPNALVEAVLASRAGAANDTGEVAKAIEADPPTADTNSTGDAGVFERDWETGEFAAGVAFRLVQAIPNDEGFDVVARMGRRLAELASAVAVLGFHAAIVYEANATLRTRLAAASAVAALKKVFQPGVPPIRAVGVLIDVGNTFRYIQRWDQALRCYDLAGEISERFTSDHANREALLARNRAIVLRDSGRFGEAEALLDALAAARPDDVEVQQSLLVLYERVGRVKDALARADQQLARIDLGPRDRFFFLHLRSLLRVRLGRSDEAAVDCLAAAALRRPNEPERLLVDTCALLTEPADAQLAAFVDACEQHVVEQLNAAFVEYPHIAVTAATTAALHRLRHRQITAAGELINTIAERLRADEIGAPWQFELAAGWHALERGLPEAFEHLMTAVAKLDQRLPMGEEASYVIGTLAEVFVDDLQRLASRASVAAVTARRADADELVPVLDVANGRDLVARASVTALVPDAGSSTTEELDSWQISTGADLVAVIDDTDTVHLLVQPAGGPRRLVDTAVPVQELIYAVRALRFLDMTNPMAPERMDARLAPWWDLAATLAATLRRELPGGSELVVLPGRLLVATPLHAAGWPDQPLIADRPVSVAPNHRLLVGQRSGPEPHRKPPVRLGVIAVPKAADTPAFVVQLTSFVSELRAKVPEAQVISGVDADEASALALMSNTEMVLVLCHGIHGGPDLGPGICVAADKILPPSHLPVTADPNLAAFVVSWDDLVTVERSPDVLVSVACSSGRTTVGPGGSRLGLEQGSLANATRFVVAPLWWVEQHTALTWVRSFMEGPQSTGASRLPGVAAHSVPALHRTATLALAERYPHPYHWAPFALTTALRGGPP